ncbi:hypothetical protein IMF27_03865 [Pseudomonas sp. PCH199]|uniref:hypothetical protein n=1 Tax=Pseudomonas sp. PCH199 TaxID=2778915 RepID=UPI0015B20626|nr:hypothetical protein [Pseudomonas sp. PCH199]MCW8274945.1 hypothetical protein [Pseudomonas sp. PCH199]
MLSFHCSDPVRVIFCQLNASRVLFAMEIDALFKRLASQDGSDLYLSTGAPPR